MPSLLFDVLVSSPAAFISLNASNPNFRYEVFGYFVFDEVHHVIKKHPYRKIARSLACVSPPPLILGLTASLTYAMGAARIQEAIVELCAELNLSGDCIFSVSPETLVADGYHSNVASSVMLSNDLNLDSSGNGLEIPGKPHQVMSDFMRCYEARSLHTLSLSIVDSIYRVEKLIKVFDAAFVTPVGASGERGKSANWSSYTNSRKKMFSGANGGLYVVLEHLYECTRLLINSRQTALELSLYYLEMSGVLTHPVLLPVHEIWMSSRHDFCRVAHLLEVLMHQRERFSEGLRCIVFVQQRITTHILHHVISSDTDLGLASDYIYATSSPATCSLSVSANKSKETVNNFRLGKIQVLFSTSVAEEGMDIPAANCVIRFDAIETPVSLVQSRGRARKAESTFVVLSENESRSVKELEKAELAQHDAISAINKKSLDTDELLQKRHKAQVSRRLNAKRMLLSFSQGTNKQPALSTLKGYAQKISGEVIESVAKTSSGFCSSLRLMQFGSKEYIASGEGPTKKTAMQNAAAALMSDICRVEL